MIPAVNCTMFAVQSGQNKARIKPRNESTKVKSTHPLQKLNGVGTL